MMKRNYSSYAEYVAHRSAKLPKVAAQLGRNEPRDLADFRSVPILGHAARCQNSANAWARPGTEVEALMGLGYFAVGIDLDPGADNRYVLPGDFHNIIFADPANVIVGTTALPVELQRAAQNLGVRRFLWWRRVILPATFPAYVTGAVTAAGGSWNASIVSEVVQWGDTTLTATGIGAYIARTTAEGDGARIALGISILCLYVLAFNRLLWRRLYNLAAERLRLD